MEREALQHLGGREPVLVDLRGELDEVARGAGAGLGRVVDVRQQAVQRVPELVEHGLCVVPGDEQRRARLPLHEVGVVRHDRRDGAAQALLLAVGVHPRPRALALARVRVEVPQADVLALGPRHLPDRHVGVVGGDLVELGELEPVELARRPVHALAQLVELQVGLDLVEIEVVLLLAELLGVVAVVPGLELEPALLGVDQLLHLVHVAVDRRHRRRPHRLHQRQRPLRRARHLRLQAPVRVALVAEQVGPLVAELQDLGDVGVVVGRVAVVPAVHERAVHLLAQPAVRGVREERLHRRAGVGDHPLALEAMGLGGPRRGGLEVVGQAVQARGGVDHGEALGLVVEHVLPEPVVEAGQPLVDGREPRLLRAVELGSGAHEVAVAVPGEPLLRRGEPVVLLALVDCGDALEQLLVLRDLVGEGGELGRQRLLHAGHGAQVQHRGVHAVVGGQALARLAGLLQREDRVLERGRERVLGDALDLGALLVHRGLEGRDEVLDLHTRPVGHTAEGPGPGCEHGVLGRVGRANAGAQDHDEGDDEQAGDTYGSGHDPGPRNGAVAMPRGRRGMGR